jgi:hypothetical protein
MLLSLIIIRIKTENLEFRKKLLIYIFVTVVPLGFTVGQITVLNEIILRLSNVHYLLQENVQNQLTPDELEQVDIFMGRQQESKSNPELGEQKQPNLELGELYPRALQPGSLITLSDYILEIYPQVDVESTHN